MTEITEALNSAQQEAVTSTAQRLFILAGAGSGKTRVLVHRIAWLREQGVSPHRIMAVTFTNKAANEMRHRIEKMAGPVPQLWVGTFHGLAHRILRQYWQEANLSENFQIIDADDQLRVLKRLCQEQKWDEEKCDPKRAMIFINRQKDDMKRVRHMSAPSSAETAMFIELYRLYEQHSQRAGIVDFAEILLRTYELWRDNPDILAHYQQRFSHLLVDEFQDTNAVQYAWLKQLCGSENHIMLVGDDDQSIYGWRGAKIENIQRLNQDFGNIVTIRLEQNYRSTSTIVAAAEGLIAKNESRLGKTLWTQGTKGDLVSLYGAVNEIDEARFIVDRIRNWCFAGGGFEDIAILYRSNAQSRVLEQTLRQSNVPYRIYGGLRFFDRAEIKDVLAYCRLLVHRNDDTAFERIINTPPRGIGERTLATIIEYAKQHQLSLWDATAAYYPTMPSGRISNGFAQFFDVMDNLAEKMQTMRLSAFIKYVTEHSGLLHHVKVQPGERTQGRVENLQELVHACEQFEEAFDALQEKTTTYAQECVSAFLSEVTLDAQNPEHDSDAAVKLMTLHSAKGLEFPLVFLSGMEDGLFPHYRCVQDKHQLEEERRLCYVGITRAMRKLYITYAGKRAFAGLSGNNRPSRFINDIPAALIDTMNVQGEAITPPALTKPKRFPAPSKYPMPLGKKVHHPRFGEGVVVGGEGEGNAARVEVNFADGRKWLVLAYAKLEEIL